MKPDTPVFAAVGAAVVGLTQPLLPTDSAISWMTLIPAAPPEGQTVPDAVVLQIRHMALYGTHEQIVRCFSENLANVIRSIEATDEHERAMREVARNLGHAGGPCQEIPACPDDVYRQRQLARGVQGDPAVVAAETRSRSLLYRLAAIYAQETARTAVPVFPGQDGADNLRKLSRAASALADTLEQQGRP